MSRLGPWTFVAAILGAALWYLYSSTSTGLLISPSTCATDGVIVRAQAAIQGAVFWKKQLQFLDRELAEIDAYPQKAREMNSTIAQIQSEAKAETARFFEEIYAKNPELRPSSAMVAAEALRARADEIERTEADSLVLKSKREEAAQLRACRKVIQSRANER